MSNSSPKYHYIKAVCWFIASLFIGCGNDVIAQHLSGQGVHAFSIAFFRLLIGVLLLIPFLLRQGRKNLLVAHPAIHLLRGILTFLAIFLWIIGVSKSSIITATLVNFMMPIFSLILAPWLLREKRSWQLGIATFIGFIGTFITLYPAGFAVDAYSTFFMIAVVCFLSLDILAKRYASEESLFTMLFYANLIATACAFIPFYYRGVLPPKEAWPFLLLIGIGGNLLLYCMLRAYRSAALSDLAPLRYLELIISISLSYLCFYKMPTFYEWIGSVVIIPTSFFVIHHQTKSKKERQEPSDIF